MACSASLIVKALTAFGRLKEIVAWGVGSTVTRMLLSIRVSASSKTNCEELCSGIPSYMEEVPSLPLMLPSDLPTASCRFAIMVSRNSTSSCSTHWRFGSCLRPLHRFLACCGCPPCFDGEPPLFLLAASSSESSSALGTSRWYNRALFQGEPPKSGETTLSENFATSGKASLGAFGLTGSLVSVRDDDDPFTKTNRISSPDLNAFPWVVRRVSTPLPDPFTLFFLA
mmetsp:Transcript_16022/g.37127  ORF Transcript_16022/g.37127 Transcript_16022/m.37127 type:complete len:227 (-) Transcript_16022:152-832(-)